MGNCLQPGAESIYWSKPKKVWIASCTRNEVRKSLFLAGAWGGGGCGRGLQKVRFGPKCPTKCAKCTKFLDLLS